MIEDIKKTLWATADKLRANMDAAEYKHLVLGLIFVKYISDTFSARRAELTRRFSDQSDDYYLEDPELLAEELEDRDYYKEVNVFWVPETARWEALRAAAKQPEIGKHIDDALTVSRLRTQSSRGSWTSATPGPSYPMASWGNWWIWSPPSALERIPARRGTCWGRSTSTSWASLPVPKARRVASSIPRRAS